MAERCIYVGMLAYDHKMYIQTHLALSAAITEIHARGWDFKCMIRTSDSHLSRGRNILVASFLESDATDFVMIDADVTWTAGGLIRLIEHPVDFVAGMYPLKGDQEDYSFLQRKEKRVRSEPSTGLVRMEHIPLGLMRLKRSVLERMCAACGDDWFLVEETGNRAYRLFEFEQHDHRSWGEDYVFCRKWTEMGGDIWVDPELTLGHCGPKTYVGNFGNWLRGRMAEATAAAAVDRKPERAFEP